MERCSPRWVRQAFSVKLPADTRRSLIEEGKGTEFRFFTNGPVKREYVALLESTVADEELVRELIALSVDLPLTVWTRRPLETRRGPDTSGRTALFDLITRRGPDTSGRTALFDLITRTSTL